MEQTTEKIVVKQEKPARNAAFELLRIIAMLFIIAHHFYVHGGFSSISPTNKALMTFFEFGGKFGVAIFVMISGYFLVNSKFKIKKLFSVKSTGNEKIAPFVKEEVSLGDSVLVYFTPLYRF